MEGEGISPTGPEMGQKIERKETIEDLFKLVREAMEKPDERITWILVDKSQEEPDKQRPFGEIDLEKIAEEFHFTAGDIEEVRIMVTGKEPDYNWNNRNLQDPSTRGELKICFFMDEKSRPRQAKDRGERMADFETRKQNEWHPFNTPEKVIKIELSNNPPYRIREKKLPKF